MLSSDLNILPSGVHLERVPFSLRVWPMPQDSGTIVSAVPSSLYSLMVKLSILKVTSSLSTLQGSQGARGPQGITGPKGTTVSVQSPGPGPDQFVCIPTWRRNWGLD